MYSQSGIHLKTGFSFKFDIFSAGQLKSDATVLIEEEVKVLVK